MNTPNNAIIFAGFYDKYIYPIRTIAIYPAIPKELRLNQTVEIASSLCERGYPVYFVEEEVPENLDFPFKFYKDEFVKKGYYLEKTINNIYKVC